jgi:hypothetical protein
MHPVEERPNKEYQFDFFHPPLLWSYKTNDKTNAKTIARPLGPFQRMPRLVSGRRCDLEIPVRNARFGILSVGR